MTFIKPKNMILFGVLSMIGALPIGFFYGLHELGKGEADRHYQPALITQLIGASVPILFFGGGILIIVGLIRAYLARNSKS